MNSPVQPTSVETMNMGEEEKLSIYMTGADEDSVFIREVASAIESMGHEVELPRRLEEDSIISELKNRARLILKEMDDPLPLKMDLQMFLSFSSLDEDIVQAFGNELRSRGVRIWNFTSRIRGVGFGPNWVEGELQALSTCCSFVVFFSRSSIKSEHVIFELDFMLERMKRRSGIFLCIVFLEDLSFVLPESVSVINLYEMEVANAAEIFKQRAVAFYRDYLDSSRDRN